MSTAIEHLITGAASVRLQFGQASDAYSYPATQKKVAELERRGRELGVCPDKLLAQEFSLRLWGQLLYAAIFVGLLCTTLYGAEHSWPTAWLVISAFAPAALHLSVQFANSRLQERRR